MPRPRNPIPKLRPHSSGQARVTIEGKDYLLGPNGSPQAEEAYRRTCCRFAGERGLPTRARDRSVLKPGPSASAHYLVSTFCCAVLPTFLVGFRAPSCAPASGGRSESPPKSPRNPPEYGHFGAGLIGATSLV